MRFSQGLAVATAVVCLAGAALPVVVSTKKSGGKTVSCTHTGLSSDLKDCGARSYTHVFVGSIAAISAADQDEKKIQIVPEEIFRGTPPNPLTVFTSQGMCLPQMAVGDRWLFYLNEETGKPIVLDFYANDSRPAMDARQEIELLRRLQTMNDRGLVRGNVEYDRSLGEKAVPNVRVVARSLADNGQFATMTDRYGRYEFQPMPSGKYRLSVDVVGPFRVDDAELEVRSNGCWDLAISKHPKGKLGGRVMHADGSPAREAEVVMVNETKASWATQPVDASGYFRFDGLRPGKYVIGIHLPGATGWKSGGGAGVPPPAASMYYPGVPTRSSALVIKLQEDEKREDLDFTVTGK